MKMIFYVVVNTFIAFLCLNVTISYIAVAFKLSDFILVMLLISFSSFHRAFIEDSRETITEFLYMDLQIISMQFNR